MQGRDEQAQEQQQPEQRPQERPRRAAAGPPARGLHVSLHGVREVELVRNVAQLGAGLADLEGVRHGHAVYLRREAGQLRGRHGGWEASSAAIKRARVLAWLLRSPPQGEPASPISIFFEPPPESAFSASPLLVLSPPPPAPSTPLPASLGAGAKGP